MTERRARTLCLLGVLALAAGFNFPGALLGDGALFRRDIAMVWAPQIESVIRQVGRGEPPFFDARRGFGQPLLADPRAEILYPPSWVHWVVPVERSYALFAWFHIVLAGFGAARFARRLWPDLSRAGELVAALAYAVSGPLLSLVPHWHHLAAAAWLPWVLEQAEPREDHGFRWSGIAACVALQALAGSPDYTFLTGLLLAARVATRGHGSTLDRVRVFVAAGLGLCAAAPQLVPSLAFARSAVRAHDGWATGALHPLLLIETILPIRVENWPLAPEVRGTLALQDQVWMLSHYAGLGALVLAAIAFRRSSRGVRRFAAVSVLLGVFLSLGTGPAFVQAAWTQLPLIGGLRFPTKHLVALVVAVAPLAGRGVDVLAQASSREARWVAAICSGLLAAAMAFFRAVTSNDASFQPDVLIEPGVALTATAIVLASRTRASRVAGFVLVFLVASDLLVANRRLNPSMDASLFTARPPLTGHLPAGARLFVSDYSIGGTLAAARRPPADPYRLEFVPVGMDRLAATTLAATWYLNPPTAGRFGYRGSFDRDILDFYPRSIKASVEDFLASSDRSRVLDRLRRGSVDFVVTMDSPEFWSGLPLVTEERRFFAAPVRVYEVPGRWPLVRVEDPDGRLDADAVVEVVEMLDHRILARVALDRPAQLVAAFATDDGWRATVNGLPTPPVDHEMGFIAIPLPAGRHDVRLEYEPPGLRMGAFVGAASVLLLLGLGLRGRPKTP